MGVDGTKQFGQGFAFPPRLDPNGQVSWSSGPSNINESILITLMTNRQERIMRPTFGAGLRTFLFEPNSAATRRLIQERIMQALNQWERRITVQGITVETDPEDRQAVVATILYQINGTAIQDQVSLKVPVAADGGD